jgi:hypothetical protein
VVKIFEGYLTILEFGLDKIKRFSLLY